MYKVYIPHRLIKVSHNGNSALGIKPAKDSSLPEGILVEHEQHFQEKSGWSVRDYFRPRDVNHLESHFGIWSDGVGGESDGLVQESEVTPLLDLVSQKHKDGSRTLGFQTKIVEGYSKPSMLMETRAYFDDFPGNLIETEA